MKGDILITGGSGTIGKAIIQRATAESWPGRISIYSRSEYLQAEIKSKYPRVNCVLGDIRDRERLTAVCAGHDILIHAAAMKRIPESEAQPTELAKTNVIGSLNVIHACKVARIKRGIFLSTDKAASPITAYGASKLMMERAIAAEAVDPTVFTIVRYGNVIASRGSVIPIWKKQAARGERLTITDPDMSRFWISPSLAVDYILTAATLGAGGIYIPKMKALTLSEMARIVCPDSRHRITGLRSVERQHEYLITEEENGRETPEGFIIDERGHPGHVWKSDSAPRWGKDEFLAMVEGG